MKKYQVLAFAFIIIFLLFSTSGFSQTILPDNQPYLVVLSMDGFRWDYPDAFPLPNLNKIAKYGVKAKAIIPSFPSITFPNHYTMATGLYPDHHGLIHNFFYDSISRLTYQIYDRYVVEDSRFYGGEPIWNTAEKQNMKSACFYWVGSETEVNNIRPSIWKKYDKKVPYEDRIDSVVKWLSLSEKDRPHLIMFYFDQPDKIGHQQGPFSRETKKVVVRMDSLVGVLRSKLDNLPIAKKINLIITTDHGMELMDSTKSIVLDKYINKDWCNRITGFNPVIMIDPMRGFTDSIILKLSNVPHLKVWRKNDMPKKLHFGTNERIGKLVILADSSYSIKWTSDRGEYGGAHGYDPSNSDMHGIFYAIGPAFKINFTQPFFENIHLYLLMAKILALKPTPTDGDVRFVEGMLQ